MDKYEALISYPQQHLHAIRINFNCFSYNDSLKKHCFKSLYRHNILNNKQENKNAPKL